MPPRFAALALFLASPLLTALTFQGPLTGPRQFGDDTIVIPMDECWQPYENTADPGSSDTEPRTDAGKPLPGGLGGACSGTYTMGALYAYGLVYYLIQNDINVFWAINPAKTTVTDVDVAVPGATTQASLYAYGAASAHDAAHGTAIGVEAVGTGLNACPQQGTCYRGGPFLIDGADFTRVYNLLSQTTGPFARFTNNVQLHVLHPSAPITANINRTLAGQPPKIGVMDLTGADCNNSSSVLLGYLTDAALNTTDGGIYDQLFASDFDVDGGVLANSNLKNYDLLWIPHFVIDNGAGSYASLAPNGGGCGKLQPDGGTVLLPAQEMSAQQAKNVMSVVDDFVLNGNNVFAECAGLGAMEGSVGATTETNLTGQRLMTDGGFTTLSIGSGPVTYNNPSIPFLQIGDFPFKPTSGAIGTFTPKAPTNFLGTEQTLASQDGGEDLLSWVPKAAGLADAGVLVYQGGHAYSGGGQNVAGERMVLNTVLSLSAGCTVPANPSCASGYPGVCAAGTYQCSAGGLTCVPNIQPGSQPEVCNGLDDDCDGVVDDSIPPIACYPTSSPAATETCQGQAGDGGYACGCHAGASFCVDGVYGACQGAVGPSAEVCDGVDNDCDGYIDDGAVSGGKAVLLSEACYDGPAGTENVGLCVPGVATCTAGAYGACVGEETPVYGLCDGLDHSCVGSPNTCEACAAGETRPCYAGPSGTLGVGLCKAGDQTCATDGGWLACTGSVVPTDAGCDGLDHNCDGQPDLCVACTPGDTQACYTGPSGTENVGICRGGTQTCSSAGQYGNCVGEVLPTSEVCDGQDDNCNGATDESAPCPTLEACVNGVCIPEYCGGELGSGCPEGDACQGGLCIVSTCGDGGTCVAGDTCASGICQNPCSSVNCGPGSICGGGQCLAGGCTSTGCATGQVCSGGSCVTDPCTGVSCTNGTFCRGGYCIEACGFVTCPSGEVCDSEGACSAPPCGGCPSGQACVGQSCVADPCASISCAAGQVCSAGSCVDDPCTGIVCPGLMACENGQCIDQIRDGGSTSATSTTGRVSVTTTGSAGSTSGGLTNGGFSSGSTGSAGTGGSGGSSVGSTSGSAGTGTTGDSSGDHSTTVSGSCGCGNGPSGGPGALLGAWPLAMLALSLRRRRSPKARSGGTRRGGWLPASGLGALFVLALATVTGCGSSTPHKTATTTGAGVTGSTGSGTATATVSGAGSTTGAATASGTVGLGNGGTGSGSSGASSGSGTSGGAGCVLCSGACVELLTDPDNCGVCAAKCTASQTCVLGACGSGVSPAPVLTALSPNSAALDSTLNLTLTGTDFAAGATVLLSGDGLTTPMTIVAASVSPTSLSASVNLAGISAGQLLVAVVNPGELLSNALPLAIVAPGVPVLTAVKPTSAPTGAPVTLQVTGASFLNDTQIHVRGGAVPDTALTTQSGGSTSLTATWDLTQVQPGTYSLFAVSPGATGPSNNLSFSVTSAVPTITTVAPAEAESNSQPALTLTGTGYDSTSQVLLGDGGALSALQGATLLSATQIYAALDLTAIAPGTYALTVKNAGTLLSAPKAFKVISAAPQISSLAPERGATGSSLSVSLTGAGFDLSSRVAFVTADGGVDGGLTLLPTTYIGPGALSGALSLAFVPVGNDEVKVINSGDLVSAGLAFAVYANAATLTSATPSSVPEANGAQTVTLAGTGFVAGATAIVTPLSGSGSADSLGLQVSSSTAGTFAIDTSGLPVGSYEVVVQNAGGQASNGINFSVTPGTPILDYATPGSTGQAIVSLELCGQFFTSSSAVRLVGLNANVILSPDGGSSAACDAGSAGLQVPVDLTNASPGTYTLAVENGGVASNTMSLTVSGP